MAVLKPDVHPNDTPPNPEAQAVSTQAIAANLPPAQAAAVIPPPQGDAGAAPAEAVEISPCSCGEAFGFMSNLLPPEYRLEEGEIKALDWVGNKAYPQGMPLTPTTAKWAFWILLAGIALPRVVKVLTPLFKKPENVPQPAPPPAVKNQ